MPSIVSAGLQVNGNMVSDGDIQIEGTIEGDVKSRTLIIGAEGLVKGSIVAEEVTINGMVEGKIKAKSVILHENSQVLGDITHDLLTVLAGARIEGSLKRLSKSDPIRSPQKDAPGANALPGGVKGGPGGSKDPMVAGMGRPKVDPAKQPKV
ncbi:MAG: bactofilin family protein [Alphaproteobacteria bacterium]